MKMFIVSLFLSGCLTINEGVLSLPPEVICSCDTDTIFDCADLEEYGRIPPYERY